MDKILIADDHVQITKILSEFAKKEGFEPVVAYDGNEVIKYFNQEHFEIILLDIGADDYIVKPFSGDEVMARVRAVLRRLERTEQNSSEYLSYDNLKVCLDRGFVSIDGHQIVLTKKEIEILWLLLENKGKIFSRDNLLNSLWGYDYYGDNRTVDSHIKRLRAKLDAFEHKSWQIKTIWGMGYKFEGINNEI